MRKNLLFLFATLLSGCSTVSIDEVDDLQKMVKLSDEYKNMAIDCLVEIKINKNTAWDSKNCQLYRETAKGSTKKHTYGIKATTAAFARYTKSDGANEEDIKKGFKKLFIIETNFNSIKELSKTIQLAIKE